MVLETLQCFKKQYSGSLKKVVFKEIKFRLLERIGRCSKKYLLYNHKLSLKPTNANADENATKIFTLSAVRENMKDATIESQAKTVATMWKALGARNLYIEYFSEN